MILKVHSSYPHSGTYVLKLHCDAAPGQGRFVGRLEHVASGYQSHFNSADELIACLVRAALLHGQPAPETES
jgi:hypothetical protein